MVGGLFQSRHRRSVSEPASDAASLCSANGSLVDGLTPALPAGCSQRRCRPYNLQAVWVQDLSARGGFLLTGDAGDSGVGIQEQQHFLLEEALIWHVPITCRDGGLAT